MFGHVADVLAEKGGQVYTTRKGVTVQDAVHEMIRKRVGALVVVDEQRPIGIFSERDVLRRVVDADRDPALTRVVEVMTPDPLTIRADCSVQEAMQIMTDHRFRHLPVTDGVALIGLVSIGDLTRRVTLYQAEHIDRMSEYIVGGAQHASSVP